MKRFLAILLAALLLTGCGAPVGVTLLTPEYCMKGPSGDTALETDGEIMDFAARLLQNTYTPGENLLLSPLSVLYALGMTAQGAGGETLAQMEDTIGMEQPLLREFLWNYSEKLPNEDRLRLVPANSVWLSEVFSDAVRQEYLINANACFRAEVFSLEFGPGAKDAINGWVSEKTDGMIDSVVNRVERDTVMYLVNALLFEGKWREPYKDGDIEDGMFSPAGRWAKPHPVQLLRSMESRYLCDEDTEGFLKYYTGDRFAFVGLLPREEISLDDYVAGLTGDKLTALVQNAQPANVEAGIPVFTVESGLDLVQCLQSMGMEDAFLPGRADFSAMAEEPLHISRVLHRTFMEVEQYGTRAAASTAVSIEYSCLIPQPEASRRVILNRPFVYMILDCEKMVPVFLGVMNDVEG